ncbi:MAG: hypothetical protein GWN93_23910 [Deltaproteobacteria bacterium]|nr:hypothetical protein [Deltaproteobacteria bacterium]
MAKRSKAGDDVPGNVMATYAGAQKMMMELGLCLVEWEDQIERVFERDGITVTGFSVRMPAAKGLDYLMTLRGVMEGEKIVTFHSASTLAEVLRGMRNRLRNNSVRWKADAY